MRVQLGRVLGKAYRVERALGAGGVGAVYEAVQVRTGRRYAVKLLLPEIAMREGAAARFRREAEALAAVGHTGIVQIHDFDTDDDGTQFLVMDLLEGEDLATRIAREGVLELPTALRIFEEIGTALSAAHAIGIVHRDLKPANVFLARKPGAPERATLLDFGLAKNLAGQSAHLTATGVGLGTPLYMSPEQARGEDVDLRTDVYALGCILFEMLTGRAPFTGPTISVVIAKILAEEPPLVSAHARRPTPAALDEVVRMALAKSATDRYATVRALVDAAHRAAGDSSDRALAATALPSPPPSPSLPATRDALTVERAALSSIRPPAASTDPSAQAATSSAVQGPPQTQGPPRTGTPRGQGTPAWAWVTIGVLATLLGVLFVGRLVWPSTSPSTTLASPTATPLASPPATTAPSDLAPADLALAPADLAQADLAPADLAPVEPIVGEHAERVAAPPRGQPEAAPRPHDAARRPQEASSSAERARPTPVVSEAPSVTSAPVVVAVSPPVTVAPVAPSDPARRAEAQATLRAYDAQIAGYRSHLRDLEDFLPVVLELQRQASSLAVGRVDAICSPRSQAQLTAAVRSDEALVASVANSMHLAIEPICTGHERWQSPSAEDRDAFAAVGRELDQADRMMADTPSSVPAGDAETVRHALASMRRLHEAQPSTFARYPCRDAAIDELSEATHVQAGWCGEAASRVARRVERACAELGMSPRRFTQLQRALSDRSEAGAAQLREAIQMYRDLVARLEGASAYVAGAGR